MNTETYYIKKAFKEDFLIATSGLTISYLFHSSIQNNNNNNTNNNLNSPVREKNTLN